MLHPITLSKSKIADNDRRLLPSVTSFIKKSLVVTKRREPPSLVGKSRVFDFSSTFNYDSQTRRTDS